MPIMHFYLGIDVIYLSLKRMAVVAFGNTIQTRQIVPCDQVSRLWHLNRLQSLL